MDTRSLGYISFGFEGPAVCRNSSDAGGSMLQGFG